MTERFMKAAVITNPRELCIEETALPKPGPNQVRIRLEGCGVCASNLPVWQGRPWFEYPLEHGGPGHEGWGIVDAIGKGVENLTAGERVAFVSSRS